MMSYLAIVGFSFWQVMWRKIFYLWVFCLFFPVVTEAKMLSFPNEVRIGESVLTLRGQGVLRVGFAFRVYQAAFYVGEGHGTEEALEDVPMRLDVNYYRSIPREQLISVADDILREITRPEELAAIQARLDQINRWYRSVGPGDFYSLVYLPDRGLELLLNDTSLGIVEGHDFARLYLAIWLSEHSQSRGIHSRLLGRG
jgi:hypothetical protein